MAGLLKRMLLAHAAALALGACGPTLIPAGYMAASRQNIGEGMPSFIVEGKTTRDEALMRMGEPTNAGTSIDGLPTNRSAAWEVWRSS